MQIPYAIVSSLKIFIVSFWKNFIERCGMSGEVEAWVKRYKLTERQ
jgi:hypothetical protein